MIQVGGHAMSVETGRSEETAVCVLVEPGIH